MSAWRCRSRSRYQVGQCAASYRGRPVSVVVCRYGSVPWSACRVGSGISMWRRDVRAFRGVRRASSASRSGAGAVHGIARGQLWGVRAIPNRASSVEAFTACSRTLPHQRQIADAGGALNWRRLRPLVRGRERMASLRQTASDNQRGNAIRQGSSDSHGHCVKKLDIRRWCCRPPMYRRSVASV